LSEFEDKLQSILGNPDAMSQIMSIAQSLTGNTQNAEPSHEADETPDVFADPSPNSDPLSYALGNMDPRLLQLGLQLLFEYQSVDDRKTALLTALQPFVKESRYAKMDRAIQIAKLSHVIRVALDYFRKGVPNDV